LIDLHCHVIPALDDGPATLEASQALCRAALEAGTSRIIATPHVNWDYPAVDAATVRDRVAELNVALREARIEVVVETGGEIALSRVGDMSDDEIALLRLGGGPYSLIECPHAGGAAAAIEAMLRHVSERGHAVVLAHPERCPVFQSDPRLLGALIEAGMLSCITARSLTGGFGSRAHAYAWELLSSGRVHAIASDAHDEIGRPPDLAPSLARAGLNDAQIEYFALASPRAIIDGGPVPRPPRVTQSRPRRWPLRRRPR
jgi:protein-tyrosine phosphatase